MNKGEPNPIKPTGGGILEKVVVTEGAAAMIAKAESVVERARLNEALKIVEELEREVEKMVMPSRFSREKVVSESPYMMPGLISVFKGLTEDKFKRAQLLRDLALLRGKILADIQGMRTIVEDIETTKQE